MKALIIFPVVLLLVTYMVIGQIIPKVSMARETNNKNEVKKTELDQLTGQLSTITAFTEEVARHSVEKEFLEEFVPTDAKEQEIINTLSRMARKHSTSISDLSLISTTPNRDVAVGSVDGSLSVIGGYEQILSLLQDLFRAKRLYQFSSVHLEKVTPEVLESGEEVQIQPDLLIFRGDFTYGHIASEPEISVADFDQALSFESIARLKEASESIEPITLKKQERSNPFLP